MTASVTTVSNGATATFSVPFPYFDIADVQVLVNDAPYGGIVTWVNPALISLAPIPAAGVLVTRLRTTPLSTPKRVFAGGAVASGDLNANQTQDLYLIEELEGESGRSVKTPFGSTPKLLPNDAALSGKFLGGSADGSQLVPLSGTGNDAALRTDLAGSTGSDLILITPPTGRPSAAPTVLRDWAARSVNVFDWITSKALRNAITAQSNGVDLQPMLQKAFDEAPLGSTLVFEPGDYRVFSTLTLRRQMNIRCHPGVRIQAAFGATTADIIDVRIDQAASGQTDARRMLIEDLNVFYGTGFGTALSVAPVTSPSAHAQLQMEIRRGSYSSPDGAGYGIDFTGLTTQAHTVVGAEVSGGSRINCADAVSYERCLFSGNKPGLVVDAIQGAFRHRAVACIFTTRDGAVNIVNVSEFDFLDNQVEQFGTNASLFKSHIQIQPQSYGAKRIRIKGNNFGGGCEASVTAITGSAAYGSAGVDDLLFDENTCGVTSTGLDVRLIDSGIRSTIIGPNNRVRGNRNGVTIDVNGVASSNTHDEKLSVYDQGLGTMGVFKSAPTLSNAWTASSGFAYIKDAAGVVSFKGHLTAGTVTAATVIGTMPAGFRPPEDMNLLCATDTATPAVLKLTTAGVLSVVSCPAAALVFLPHVIVGVQTTYDPGV